MVTKNCEYCGTEMILKTVNKKGSKNIGDIIAIHKNKKFCSTECQNNWQKQTKWEDRIGLDAANKIRTETSERVKGAKNPTTNPETAKKVSSSLKKYLEENPEERKNEKNGFFDKKHTDEYKKWATESRKGKDSCNPQQRQKQIDNHPKGDKHPLWNGGSSFGSYAFDFNKKLKTKIKIRDNYTCVVCGKKTQKISIHHIDYDKMNSNEKNLISLCISCHSKTTPINNRKNWIDFFDSIIKEKYDNMSDNNNGTNIGN
ncbi:HNH endonuclease [Candidatus Dojkabacteria bacterium]|jgi:5-methylcytosine-specific restriction endonuclease McrA|nr:HNH endonuclease [Candidatus Dojkabacteria bacterium]